MRLLAVFAVITLIWQDHHEVQAQIVFGGSTNSRNQGSSSSNSRPSSFGSNSRGSSGSRRCVTVSGPKVGARCVFPFTFNGVTYTGCPIDPEDNSKRWCSTKTDSSGNHVGGQGEYGHCGSNCPIWNEGSSSSSSKVGAQTSSSSSSRPRPNVSSGSSSGCSGSDKCRSIGICSVQFTESEMNNKQCTLPDGSSGLCCPDLTTNNVRSVFPDPDPVLSGPEISNVNVRQAVDVGQSFVKNMTQFVTLRTSSVKPNTATATHSKFQKAKPGVSRLNEVALVATEAFRNLQSLESGQGDPIGIRQADTSNTVLENCYARISCNNNSPFRTFDGSCNSLRDPKFGRALTPVQRVLRNAYADGLNSPRASRFGSDLPSARLVSTQVSGSVDSPSGRFTSLLMSFGQFLDHDLDHVPIQDNNGNGIDCCTSDGRIDLNSPFATAECFPIKIPPRDFFNFECMNFVRSQLAPRLDCLPGPSEQINQITHWIDASNVYGSSNEEANELRSFRGGSLRVQRSSFGTDLLPDDRGNGDCRGRSSCFLAGDGRNSEQPNLALMHLIFVREHNRLARELQNINPSWNDERLFQEARRILIAQWQHIIYNEFLPILLGRNYMNTFGLWPLNSGFSRDYRDDFDPRITNEFAAAAFRVGHTMIPSLLRTARANGRNAQELLRNLFFDIDALRSRGGVDGMLLGMTQFPVENVDDNFSEEISNHLFDGPLNGMDLVALNIQRGRDHGIPGYIEYRRICRVGGIVRSFDDLSDTITPDKIARLRRVYQSVEDIDLFVGMSLETPNFNGALTGPTFLCLIGDQFARLKKGDRYFYDLGGQPGSFTQAQLNEIRKTTLARILCDNGDDIQRMQPLAFQLPNSRVNQIVPCNSNIIPRVNLSPWAEGRQFG